MTIPAVFLDRDGTLNRPAPPGAYIVQARRLRLFDGAAEAVALLRAAGYACIVVSNQRGVALGAMTADDLRAVDERLRELVAVDASYYCTHDLGEACPCRKPRAGLLVRAAADLDIDLGRSWMVGDRESDCEAGRRVGCRTIRIEPRDCALLTAARRIVADGRAVSDARHAAEVRAA